MDKYYFLNDLEKELVEAFYKNETQREAVKKVLLMGVYNNGVMKPGEKHNPSVNWALSHVWDEKGVLADPVVVGRAVQLGGEAIRSVELAFQELSKFNKPVEKPVKKNNAR